jgi:hypothetical protein
MGFFSDYVSRYGVSSTLKVVNVEWVLRKLEELSINITDLLTGTDLNTILTPGYYCAPANATAQTIKNTPWGTGSNASAVSFSMEVVKHAGVTQILRTYNTSGEEYQRQYYNGSWGVWVRMARTTDELTPLAHTHIKSQITDFEHTHEKSQITDFEHIHDVVSKTANGFVPRLPNETTTTKYLRQDGAWEVPPDTNTDTDTTYSEMSETTLGLVRLNGSYTFTGTINVTTPPLPG